MAFLAPPPADPIDIDYGVRYWHTIAQQGYSLITVDPNPNFTFNVGLGSPAVLAFTYTGSTPNTDSLTIRLTTGATEVAQTLNFVIGATGPRLVPSLTNTKGQSVIDNTPFQIQITSDIAADSYTAFNLPVGLSVTAGGLIHGTTPSATGSYIITLVATLGAKNYKNHYVLTVNAGTPPTAPPPIIGGDTAAIEVFYDGDFTIAQPTGPPQFEVPFSADPKPYVYKLSFWQFIDNYTELPFGSPGPMGGFYVGGTPGTFNAIGGGIVEFQREYALVPDSRNEYESFVYSYVFLWFLIGRVGYSERPFTSQSRLQFDYFQTDHPQNDIDLPRAPAFWDIEGNHYYLHGFQNIAGAPTGTEVLAEDATYKLWKGNIYERIQRFIRWIHPSDVLFGDA